jgi:Lar family restriction alleviation protein
MILPALEPCPHCGSSNPEIRKCPVGCGGIGYVVVCDYCGSQSGIAFGLSREGVMRAVIELWNRRYNGRIGN